jgi:hypothetical protein
MKNVIFGMVLVFALTASAGIAFAEKATWESCREKATKLGFKNGKMAQEYIDKCMAGK